MCPIDLRKRTLPLLVMTSILFLLSTGTLAQWSWRNPLPQGNTIHDVQFMNGTKGFGVGDGGTILKTVDGGYTWSRIETSFQANLNSVFFVDSLLGFAISGTDYGYLVKTTDGGATWNLLHYFDTFYMYDVWFTDALHGTAVGEEGVFTTHNGGITWLWNGPYTWNYAVWYTNTATAIMSSEGYLYKSYDGGNTWAIKQQNVFGYRGSLFFMNADTGFHVGGGGQIFRTLDAGEHWDTIHSGTTKTLSASYILPSGIGYTVGYSGTMLKTVNAGTSWSVMPSVTTSDLESITFSSSLHGIITGQFGLLMVTEDAGTTWTILSSNATLNNLNSICFTDQNRGFIAGADGILLKTTDGGNSWQSQQFPTSADFTSLCFTDTQTGYVTATNGAIFKTVNGGVTWDSLATGVGYRLGNLNFPDNGTGYACGFFVNGYDTSYLLKTTNAGATWVSKPFSEWGVTAMCFSSPDTGYFTESSGKINQTTDGGVTWHTQYSNTNSWYWDLCFPTAHKGFACGDNKTLVTQDAGLHWNPLESAPVSFMRMFFLDSLTGYALGPYYPLPRVLYRTEDGGLTWSEKVIDETCYMIRDLFFTDHDSGFICGDNGVVLTTTTGGGIITGTDERPPLHADNLSLYPNPCSEKIHIRLPSSVSSFSVAIFTLTGQEVLNLDCRQVFETDISLPYLSPGIYLIRIRTDEEVVVKKVAVSR